MSDRRQAEATSVRIERLLTGPIVPTLLSLAAPMVLVLTVQAAINLVETHFIGELGVEPLAGAALVFPVIILMQMVSSGGLGGGIASAVARAVGAGRQDRAAALVGHGLILATVCGAGCSVLGLAIGPGIYRALGNSGQMVDAALGYSDTIFAGVVLLWWSNALASSLRGSGEMLATAAIIFVAAVSAVVLSPCLILGLGPFPRLGVVGAGLAVLSYYGLCVLGFLTYLIRVNGWRRLIGFDHGLFADILSVGGLSTLMALQSSLAVIIVTGLADHYGSLVLAGYGIGSRLDALLVPPIFGLGAATVTMVGMNIGAGQTRRAERIAWLGALIAALVLEAIGLGVALFPHVWLRLFSDDAEVLKAGAGYLGTVAPFYGFLGIGTILHFAAIGAGRPRGPLLGITLRVLIAAGGGAVVVAVLHGAPQELFAMVAYGLVAFAAVNAVFVLRGSLGRGRPAEGPQLGSNPAARNPPSTTKVWPVT
jgi:putative MATE family efflux protein